MSTALDLDRQAELGTILERVARKRAGLGSLWHTDYPKLLSTFRCTAKKLGLSDLKLSPHGLRHGGASTDRSLGVRSLASIQLRGNWRAAESLRRYEKHARLGMQLQRLGTNKVQALDLLASQLKGNCAPLFGKLF